MRQTPRFSVRSFTRRCEVFAAFLLALGCLSPIPLHAQTPPSPDAQDAAQQPSKPPDNASPASAEVVTRDSAATFKVRVNLVLLRVVVRDQNGKVVDNLKKEDFLLFDNRKPQTISTFSLETPLSHAVPIVTVSDHPDSDAVEKNPSTVAALPHRFVSLLFDDLHLAMEDAVTVRVAATKVFDSMAPSDRAAIFTTSGQFSQEFTSDHELLKKSLNQIVARPLTNTGFHECPEVTYYQADLIENRNDLQALAVATEDAVQCAFNGDETKVVQARSMA